LGRGFATQPVSSLRGVRVMSMRETCPAHRRSLHPGFLEACRPGFALRSKSQALFDVLIFDESTYVVADDVQHQFTELIFVPSIRS
jgi:hypothetical protein